jgi:hypothetical protein
MGRWLCAVAVLSGVVLSGSACDDEPDGPGREKMGTYELTAEVVTLADGGLDPGYQDCTLRNPGMTELPSSSFPFEVILTRNPDTNETFLTLGGVTRPATFDGQFVESTFFARREFANCCVGADGQNLGQLEERLRVALLSRSQSDALGGRCPPNPLDGGVPGPDAGVTPPGSIGTGFDALRACGELVDVVRPGDCGRCSACTLRYPVTGVRR